ncbi:MAG: hypothetical protein ACEPOZ_01075 [Marinifilaceae bacterium]
MKKICLVLLLFVAFEHCGFAQKNEKLKGRKEKITLEQRISSRIATEGQWEYCKLKYSGSSLLFGAYVEADFGAGSEYLYKGFKGRKKENFESEVEVLNLMGKYDWELVQVVRFPISSDDLDSFYMYYYFKRAINPQKIELTREN